MRATEAFRFNNISAATTPFALYGGLYQVSAQSTDWGSGTLVLEQLGPNQTGYLSVTPDITADGGLQVYLPPGQYRFHPTSVDQLDVLIVRVPVE